MVFGPSEDASPPTSKLGHMSPPEQRRQHKTVYRRTHSVTPHLTVRGLQKRESSASSEEDRLSLTPTAIDAHRRDLFGSYPVQITGQSLEALDEQLGLVASEELVLDVRGGSQHPMLITVFARSLQDVGLFSCYVAAAQSLFQQRRSPKQFKASDQLVALQQQGLSHIRDRIMRPNAEMDDVLIASITQLMVADSVCGNVQSLMSHQRGVRKLIGMRKTELDDAMFRTSLGVIVVIEMYMALMQLVFPPRTQSPAPADNPLRYIKHPFPASVCVRMSQLPSGLEDLVFSSKCSLQTIDLLEHLTSWSSSLQALNGDTDRTSQAYSTLFTEPMSSSRSAIFILRNLRHANAELTFEYLLCLGIIIVIKHQRQTKKTDYLEDEMLQSFTRSVKQYPNPSECEVATIIWLVAVVAWRASTAFKAQADDLVDFIIQKYDQAQDMNTAQAIWRNFLWYQTRSGAWSRLWQMGLDRFQASKVLQKPAIPKLKSAKSFTALRDWSALRKEDSNESRTSSSNVSRPSSTLQSAESVTSQEMDFETCST